jgi:hypothetical protein
LTLGKRRKWVLASVVAALLVLSLLSADLLFQPAATQTGHTPYIAIQLFNNQKATSPSGLQQLIVINPSLYSRYESSDLSNLRFYTSTLFISTNVMSAWLQSYSGEPAGSAPNEATAAAIWVKVPASIPPLSQLKIFMAFGNSSGFNQYFGEAPDLSGIYGQFDNGANVFNFYDDFAGVRLSASWSVFATTESLNYTVDNGLELSGHSPSEGVENGLQLFTKASYDGGILETQDLLGISTTPANGALEDLTFYFTVPSTSYGQLGMGNAYSYEFSERSANITLFNSGTQKNLASTSLGTGAQVISAVLTGGGQELDQNYTELVNSTDHSEGCCTSRVGLGIETNSTQSVSLRVTWLRLRTYPANGVMPLVSLGSAPVISQTLSQAIASVLYGNLSIILVVCSMIVLMIVFPRGGQDTSPHANSHSNAKVGSIM